MLSKLSSGLMNKFQFTGAQVAAQLESNRASPSKKAADTTSVKSGSNDRGSAGMRDKILAEVMKVVGNFVTKLEYEDQKIEIQRALSTIGVFKYKIELQEQMMNNKTFEAKVD